MNILISHTEKKVVGVGKKKFMNFVKKCSNKQ